MKSEQEIKKELERLQRVRTRYAFLNDPCISKSIELFEWVLEDTPRKKTHFIRIPHPKRLEWVVKDEDEEEVAE